jgi:hypothetical protein
MGRAAGVGPQVHTAIATTAHRRADTKGILLRISSPSSAFAEMSYWIWWRGRGELAAAGEEQEGGHLRTITEDEIREAFRATRPTEVLLIFRLSN